MRHELPVGATLRRIFWPESYGATALSFRTNGPRSRFDHHRRPGPFPGAGDDEERGVAYASPHLGCCLAECFGDEGVVDGAGAWLAVLEVNAPLTLLDVRGKAAMKAGTVAAIGSDGNRRITQDWARHWYDAADLRDVHGLLFAGAHTGQDAVALWERAAGRLDLRLETPLSAPDLLKEVRAIAEDLQLAVLP